jgi:hypothetical protein
VFVNAGKNSGRFAFLILARELWERTASTLPEHLRDAFGAHPTRIGSRQLEAASSIKVSGRQEKLTRLIDIFCRLNSSLRTDEVLSRTMDAAIDLTGAQIRWTRPSNRSSRACGKSSGWTG